MRIRWRGLELPSRVQRDEAVSTDTYAKFTAEPFERGFGTTVGNSLRRILLSSLEGAAVTHIKLKGAEHEFSSLRGVMEDVTDIILNVKSLIVKLDADEPKEMRLVSKKQGPVTAGMIEADPSITIVNKDLVIATMTEDARVGQKTDYDRLILEIWTNGTVTPEMALVEASKILRKHLNPFVQYFELGSDLANDEAVSALRDANKALVDPELENKLNMTVQELDLSVRANNCLESARVETVAQLVSQTEADLLKLRSFGRTSLREVKRKLQDLQLDLGMQLPDGFTVAKTEPQG